MVARLHLVVAVVVVIFQVLAFCSCGPAAPPTRVHDHELRERAAADVPDLFTEPEVFITISSVVEPAVDNVTQDTLIELNWARFPPPEANDWVGLFDYDVGAAASAAIDHKKSALAVAPLNPSAQNNLTGYHKTAVKFGHPLLDGSSNGDNCLGYWIGYMRKVGGVDSPVLTNCFRKYPTWMNDLKSIIGDVPLHSLMIPGTHDAGAIQPYDPVASDPVSVRYNVCQEKELYMQFVHGIRYLDMRVAHYPSTPEKFWINHGSMRYAPLITLFDAVKKFVNETNELIFMDFHGFPVGMADVARHEELVAYVQEHVGHLLIHRSNATMNLTLNDVWSLKKNVLLTYERAEIQTKYDFLWPYLIHAWGNVNKVQPLEDYFANVALPTYGCTGVFWSSQAEMTPKESDYILYPFLGLRGMAQMVNIPLTYWWQRPEWYSRSMIVSTDFFLGSNIIEMAVKVNRNRAVCPEVHVGVPAAAADLAVSSPGLTLTLALTFSFLGVVVSF